MRNLKKKQPSQLEPLIAKLLDEMTMLGPGDDEYDKRLTELERLYALQTEESKRGINPDTLMHVAGSLASILTIVAYEQKHVMTSTALKLLHRKRDM